MNRNIFEVAIGVVSVMISILFVTYVIRSGLLQYKNDINFPLKARFNNIEGIKVGSSVKIGGVSVGKVKEIDLNYDTFQVEVEIEISSKIKVPVDSSLSVTSSGIFGGKHLAIRIGFEEDILQENGYFASTQSSTNLEDLISKFATSK